MLYIAGGKKGKLVQPHWNRVLHNQEELDVAGIPLLLHILEKLAPVHQGPCIRMCPAGLFLRANTWKQPTGFLAAERINTL